MTETPPALPALDPRVVREVGRMADGRRITYIAWRDETETAAVALRDDGKARCVSAERLFQIRARFAMSPAGGAHRVS